MITQDSEIPPEYAGRYRMEEIEENRASTEKIIRPIIERLLQPIMEIQEKELGIQYSEIPKVEYVTIFGAWRSMEYAPNNSTIKVTTEWCDNPGYVSFVAKHSDHEDFLADILSHELGHHFTYQLVKEHNILHWLNLSNDDPLEQVISNKLISEGISVYFEFIINSEISPFHPQMWPQDLESWKPEDFNVSAYYLVKPIIDHYKEEGILKLLLCPTTPTDLKNLLAYQTRILDELSENK